MKPLPFFSIPLVAFHSEENKNQIWKVKISFQQISGIAQDTIEINHFKLNINCEENCNVIIAANFVGMTTVIFVLILKEVRMRIFQTINECK